MVYFVIAAFLGAIGQFLYKTGATKTDASLGSFLLNPFIWLGVICYISVMVLFLCAFKKGGSLTVLYPIYATTFIWASLIAYYAFGTPIKLINIVGMLILILGMYLLGK